MCIVNENMQKLAARRSDANQQGRKRTGLLWKLNENKRAGQLCVHENMHGQAKNGTQERKDLWEIWAASLDDALRIFRERVHGRAEGSSTWCTLEDQQGGPPYMQMTLYSDWVLSVGGGFTSLLRSGSALACALVHCLWQPG